MAELYGILPELVKYEIYGYIKEEVELIKNWSNFSNIFETYKKKYISSELVASGRDTDSLIDIRIPTPTILMKLYDTCFPEDQIYDVFSPSDNIREMIATDTIELQLYHTDERPIECEEWRDDHNNRFECLQKCPTDYFHFSIEHSYYGEEIYEWRWLHTVEKDRKIMAHFFYEDMKKIITEKLEDPSNYASLYNLYVKCKDELDMCE
jgi:hypothetical protein